MIEKIRKRNGNVVKFSQDRICGAVLKAAESVGEKKAKKVAEDVAKDVVKTLEKEFEKGRIPTVENVQDHTENVLMARGYFDVAKAYILYRAERASLREEKEIIGLTADRLKLSLNASLVLAKRYLLKDDQRRVIESPAQMFRRVATNIAGGDKKLAKKYYKVMTSFDFLPSSPILMNAGTKVQMLFACFFLEVPDDLGGIFETIKNMAIIQAGGGGTGLSFSKLRRKGGHIHRTGGVSSGPVSFMRVFNSGTDVIKQGGKRRGANIGVLRVDHPDVMEFIRCKERQGEFKNFNVSIAITDEFMTALDNKNNYDLVDPNEGLFSEMSAEEIWSAIILSAWSTGDPGILFIDTANQSNTLTGLGEYAGTNPCGEVFLFPYEACNLGSVNLSHFVKDGKIDFKRLKTTVEDAVDFLNRVIDVSKFPLSQIEKNVKKTRKLGLGVMGFADMLIQLGIPYDSEEAIQVASNVMRFIKEASYEKSHEIAKEEGSFPAFDKSIFDRPTRNATLNAVAPTGTLSIIANCSSAIEPLFSVVYMRNILGGKQLLEVHPLFEKIAKERGFYFEGLMIEVAKTGSVQNVKEVPDDVKRLFRTAHEILPKWHIRMQAAFQEFVDSSVSKTINLPHDATPNDVADVYKLAYSLKCKGITIYRDKSKKSQVLEIRPQVPKMINNVECPKCNINS